jgi:YfiH family protein
MDMPSPLRPGKADAGALEAVDAQFRKAGLDRAPRDGPAGPRAERFQQSDPTELTLAAPPTRRDKNGVEWLPVPGWEVSWLWSGFSTRNRGVSRSYCPEDGAGELNLGFTAHDDRRAVIENRRLLSEAVTGQDQTPLVTLRQFHSNVVIRASAADAAPTHPHEADGLMTDETGFLIAIQTADCIPVLVVDLKRRAVAAFHAGWRGTVKRIVESGVGRMRLEFGSRPGDLVAAIGPGIGACCYAIGEEVVSEFQSQFSYAPELFREVFDADPVRKKYPMLFLTQRAPGHSSIGPSLHVDLVEANRRQLLDAGLSRSSIRIVGGCTQCHQNLFYSHRASHGHCGRMMAVIGIRTKRKND